MKKVKEILFIIIIVIGLVGVYKGLVLLDNYNKNNAIERCGGANNVIAYHDNNGDKFYTCKK